MVESGIGCMWLCGSNRREQSHFITPLSHLLGHELITVCICAEGSSQVRQCFQQDGTEAVLLVDASNAFNSLTRNAALHNIRFECPAISTILMNTYRGPSELFIDGEVIYSQEGITQGDPLAMPMYAVATLPLIKRLPKSATQVWYADDGSALGTVTNLREWWDELARLGPGYGYFPNPSKTWLDTKEDCHSNAVAAFEGTNINVTSSGRPYCMNS